MIKPCQRLKRSLIRGVIKANSSLGCVFLPALVISRVGIHTASVLFAWERSTLSQFSMELAVHIASNSRCICFGPRGLSLRRKLSPAFLAAMVCQGSVMIKVVGFTGGSHWGNGDGRVFFSSGTSGSVIKTGDGVSVVLSLPLYSSRGCWTGAAPTVCPFRIQRDVENERCDSHAPMWTGFAKEAMLTVKRLWSQRSIWGPSFWLRSLRQRSPDGCVPGFLRVAPAGEERCTPHYTVPVSPQCPRKTELLTLPPAAISRGTSTAWRCWPYFEH